MMTKSKRLFSMFIIITLVLMLLPVTVFADDPPSPVKITNINITGMVAPKVGRPCTVDGITVTTDLGDAIEVKKISWHDSTLGMEVTDKDVFRSTHGYYLKAILAPKAGYMFEFATDSSSTYTGKITIEGTSLRSATEYTFGSGELYLNSDYLTPVNDTTSGTEITYTDISGVTEPLVGESPDYDVTVPEGVNYHLATDDDLRALGWEANQIAKYTNGISWICEDTYEVVPSSSVFDAGKKYCMYFALVPETGYKFSDTVYGTLNGTNAFYSGAHTENANSLLLGHSNIVFPFTTGGEVVSSIAVDHVPTPLEGETCSMNGITVTTDPADAMYISDMFWYDCTEEARMGSTNVFIGGHKYRFEIELAVNPGYGLTTQNDYYFKTSKINGVKGEYDSMYQVADTHLTIFGKEVEIIVPISSVDISGISLPVAGGNPDFTGILPEDAPYHLADYDEAVASGFSTSMTFINGITWGEGLHYTLEEKAVFNANKKYRFAMLLIPKEGYTFAENCTGTVNGTKDPVNNIQVNNSGTNLLLHSVELDVAKPLYSTAVTSSALNVRSTPEVAENRIGGLIKNSVIQVLERIEADGIYWYKIAYGTEIGYVQEQYTHMEPQIAFVLPSALNVREETDKSSARVGEFVKGQQVAVLDLIDTDGDPTAFEWAKIIFNNQVAYVMAEFLGFGGIGSASPEYSIISGDDQTYSGSGDISVKADGDISFFDHLEMDDVDIDESNYTVISGSTDVTLKESYLQTLTPGEHKLKYVYIDGSVVATLNIPDASAPEPGTGDEQSITVSFKKIVKQGGTQAPGSTTFNFDLMPYGNADADISGIVIAGNSVRTNGKGEYEGTITISGDLDQMIDAEGLKLAEKNEALANWTYDETVYVVQLAYDRNDDPYAMLQKDIGEDMNPETAEVAEFTNTFTANETPDTKPTPSPTDGSTSVTTTTSTKTPATTSMNKFKKNTPKTGDHSNMLLWITLLFVSFSGIVAIYFVRKKRTDIR